MAGAAVQIDRLQGTDISASRLQDNVNKSLAQLGVISTGKLIQNQVIPAGGGTIPNPLGRTAQGFIPVLQDVPCQIAMTSSTSSTLTLVTGSLVKLVNGVITAPFGNGPVTVSFVVF
jgi:hypothetical protein